MSKPIRVLHYLTEGIDCGGIESFLINVYRNIDINEIQFDFMAYCPKKNMYEEEIIERGGRIYKLRTPIKNIYNHLKEVDKILKEHREYKIIHIHTDYAISYFVAKIAKKYGINVIIHSHQTKVMNKKFLIHKLLKRMQSNVADVKLACSMAAAEWMFTRKDNKNGNVKIINNAIDVEKFIYNEQTRNKIRNELGIQDKFVIGHVGRLTAQKNQKFLIEIYNEIYKRNKESVLLIIGNGRLEQKLKEQVKKLHIENNVIFLSNINNVNEYYQAMDVFVLPSLYEGLGIVNIEAQTSGLKTIVSDVVPKEANIINKNFITIPLKENAKYWATEILKCNNNYKREDMSKIVTEKGYNIKQQANKLMNLYKEYLRE